jgi:NADPH2:quinone reductase
MRAWLLDDLKGISSLRLADVPEPQAARGEVVLDVRYAALNPADRYLAENQYPARPPLPHVLGRDGVGAVVSVGPDVKDIRPGDRFSVLRGDVGVSRWGTFAERVAVPVQSLVEAPREWTEQQASAATLVYLTAWQALTQWPDLPRPATVLVTGASGGVGVASVQLAAAMGHRVVGLSRDPRKAQKIKELGAEAVFDPQDKTWRKAAKDLLAGKGVDLAIDNIGGTLLPEVIETLGYGGRVSLVGRLAGPVPEFNTASMFFRRLKLGGVAVGTYQNAEARAAWGEVLKLMNKTGARPLVDGVFPFDQLPAAFERLARGPMGKVLLAVSGPVT